MSTGFILTQLSGTGVKSLISVLAYYTYKMYKFIYKKENTKEGAVYCLLIKFYKFFSI